MPFASYDIEKITKDKLYGITKKLYTEKEGLENHLSKCTNELFNLEDKINLYDPTNTYTEGRMHNSRIAKAAKENSMHNQFAQRFEEGLRGIQNSIGSTGGTKKLDKIWERIGRLKEKYSSVHQYYEITVSDNGKGIATGLAFEKKREISPVDKAGIYFLCTSLNGKDEQTLWPIGWFALSVTN